MSDYSKQVIVKEYDTIDIRCQYLDDNGYAVSLNEVTVLADVRSMAGKLVDHLTVTITEPLAGKFEIQPSLDHIPVGFYQIDILFINTITNTRVASETFRLDVKAAVTAPR